jgi:predicted phage terminase large subunit-like protein
MMLQERRRARIDLIAYARYIDIPGVPLDQLERAPDQDDWYGEATEDELDPEDFVYAPIETPLAEHHLLILEPLQDMVYGKLLYEDPETGQTIMVRRVMIMLPPGSAKSTYASVVFPTWVQGRFPGHELILTGYGDVICKRHGKRARQIVDSAKYRHVFNTGLDPKTRAADDWQTEKGSSYKAAGILSGITGFRADGLIWDDLTKGRKEADSETIRNDTYNAYIDDARSRKKPLAWEVGIGTRWHEDEIMGRILPEGYSGESGFMKCRDGNIWYVICLPAECERSDDLLGRKPGEYIWPEWFGEDYWAEKKMVPRSWASLYQQRPAPDTGLYFQRKWFKTWTELPENLTTYMCWDPAVTDEEDGGIDETAIYVVGVDQYGKLYIIDGWVQAVTMDVWVSQLITMAKIHKPMAGISEKGVIRQASEPYLAKECDREAFWFRREYMTRSSNKPAMSRSFQAMCSAGRIYVPPDSVGQDLVDECVRFPTSKLDNRVDAVTNLCLFLDELWEANPPVPEKKKPGKVVIEHKVKDFMPARRAPKKSKWQKR